ncbi:DMT family transporter [Sphingomonas sp. TF3]|uniref:DMT family transporter n=1 Tax=Sphingomonas sp. TF3 TaxID=2495580 RepID=UPI000F87F75B|nr:DMT family transporter [Sphingomonas sp. TF3]RUN76541.1 DMT family transporter [Sphingomonas sp. TF3]
MSVARRRISPNLIGGGWILLSAVTFTTMITLVKYLGEGYPPAVESTYRQIASVIVLAPVILRGGWASMKTSRPWLMIAMVAMSTASLVLSLRSYQLMPFAKANALSFTKTLWLVPLARIFLRERLDAVRAGVACVGFGGVLVMLSPGRGFAFGTGEMVALAAALTAAGVIICMKALSGNHKMRTILAWSATVGLGFSLVPALPVWRWPTPVDLLLLLAMGAMGVATQATYLKGLSIGEAAAITPVDYSRLLMVALLGWLLFNELPTVSTLVGAAMVIVATLLLSWHEMRRYRAQGAVLTALE